MATRRTILKWGTATGAGLVVSFAYRGGHALSAVSPFSKSGLLFGYQPFTQPLFIPPLLTSLTTAAHNRLSPAPGFYPRGRSLATIAPIAGPLYRY